MVFASIAFPRAKRIVMPDFGFQCLDVGEVSASRSSRPTKKVGTGAREHRVDWAVADLDAEIARLTALGAVLYRGPMKIESGLQDVQTSGSIRQFAGTSRPLIGDFALLAPHPRFLVKRPSQGII